MRKTKVRSLPELSSNSRQGQIGTLRAATLLNGIIFTAFVSSAWARYCDNPHCSTRRVPNTVALDPTVTLHLGLAVETSELLAPYPSVIDLAS